LLSLYYQKTEKITLPFEYNSETIESLLTKGWLFTVKNKLILKRRGTKLIQRLNKNKGLLDIDKEFVRTFRSKWKGLKPGSMGSLAACEHKLNR